MEDSRECHRYTTHRRVGQSVALIEVLCNIRAPKSMSGVQLEDLAVLGDARLLGSAN
jgi:hypothetical protein